LEEVLLIECEISALQLAIELFPITSVEEEWFLYLVKLDETRNDVALANEAHKNRIKVQYDKFVQPRAFSKGDLVLIYHQANDKLEIGKL
jgi:hypothetical protein